MQVFNKSFKLQAFPTLCLDLWVAIRGVMLWVGRYSQIKTFHSLQRWVCFSVYTFLIKFSRARSDALKKYYKSHVWILHIFLHLWVVNPPTLDLLFPSSRVRGSALHLHLVSAGLWWAAGSKPDFDLIFPASLSFSCEAWDPEIRLMQHNTD